jgi:hypothetical protein
MAFWDTVDPSWRDLSPDSGMLLIEPRDCRRIPPVSSP